MLNSDNNIILIAGSIILHIKQGKIKEEDLQDNLIIIYINDLELSREYAKKILKKHTAIAIFSLESLFRNKKDDIYNYICDHYVIHIKKYKKQCRISLFPYHNEDIRDNIFDYIIQNSSYLILKTEINIYIIKYYIKKHQMLILGILVVITFIFNYNTYFSTIDMKRKEFLIKTSIL